MIRLCMLARDEADAIAGVAEACGDLVDDYCVLLDHRSTDETDAAIVRELGEWGRVIPFRFRDFADARNQLFQHARQGLGAGDYLLLADPDSPPRGDLPAELAADVYECEWEQGGVSWRLPILVRATLEASYVGACHELLHHSGTLEHADRMYVNVAGKPPSPERWQTYAELLERDAATNPRSAFYLARTLTDLGRPLEAAGWYLLRAQMLGWVEETYLSLLNAGELLKPYDAESGRGLLERARRYRPERLEAVHALAVLANQQRRHGEAVELATAGLLMPRSSDRLLVNRWAEREGLQAQLALALGELAAAASTVTLTAEEAPHG